MLVLTFKRSFLAASSPSRCNHRWEPQYDYCWLHVQRYRCRRCGLWGSRTFGENTSLPTQRSIVPYPKHLKIPPEAWQNRFWEEWAKQIVERQNEGEEL